MKSNVEMLHKVTLLYKAKLHLEAAAQLFEQALGGTDSGQMYCKDLAELVSEAEVDIIDLQARADASVN